MKTHSDRMRRSIRDLNKIDLDLMFHQIKENNSEEQALLFELKSAADNLRTSMWGRMRADENQEYETTQMIEDHRMRRVARLVLQYPVYTRPAQLRKASLIAQFEDMAETALQDHPTAPTMQLA